MEFRRRATGDEIMDRPDSDEGRLFRTLDQFAFINRWLSRSRSLLSRHILADLSPGDEAHLVDLGAGACDIPVWLLGEARRRGLALRITAVDADPRTVRYATARHGGEPGLRILQADALDLDALAPFDYLFANHFLHHLPDPVLPKLLADALRLTRRGLLFNDLRRSRASYLGFSLLGLGFRRSFTRPDGLLSIRKGFTPRDLRGYIGHLPLRVHTCFPGRVVVSFLRDRPRGQVLPARSISARTAW